MADLSLGETSETPDLALSNINDPTTFNLDEWIAGVQPTIHTVPVYGRADLLAEIEAVEAALRIRGKRAPESSLGDEPREELEERLAALLAQFTSSRILVKVRGRSDEWRDRTIKKLSKSGIRDKNEQTLRMIAESIVEPPGFTWEHLAKLQDVSESQVKMLAVAWTNASVRPPSADFSQPSSVSPDGRARGSR